MIFAQKQRSNWHWPTKQTLGAAIPTHSQPGRACELLVIIIHVGSNRFTSLIGRSGPRQADWHGIDAEECFTTARSQACCPCTTTIVAALSEQLGHYPP